MSLDFLQKIIDVLRLHLSKEILWEHYKKYKEIEKYKDNTETLILGSSHGVYGYNAIDGEYNLALSSQDLYYSFKLYEKYSAELPKLKNIILFYSVFSNGFILDKTGEKQRVLAYKNLFKIPVLNDSLYFKVYNLSFPHYLGKVKKRLINYNHGNIENPKFFVDPEITPELRAKQHLKNNLRPNKQNYWVENLINLAKNNKHCVYIVLSPATDAYKNCLPDSKELFKDILDLICDKDVCLVDLYNSELFTDEDFGDLDHLNSNGAEKLSNYVRNLIR